MGIILRFPHTWDDEQTNRPITDETQPARHGREHDRPVVLVTLVNAIGAILKAWVAEHPQVTREDIEWALDVVLDCIVEGE